MTWGKEYAVKDMKLKEALIFTDNISCKEAMEKMKEAEAELAEAVKADKDEKAKEVKADPETSKEE